MSNFFHSCKEFVNGTFRFAANGEAENKIPPRIWTGNLNSFIKKVEKYQKINIDFSWELSSELGISDYWWNRLVSKHI